MQDSSDRIIYVALGVAVLFGILSFFWMPLYEKGAWAVIGLAVLIATNVMSFKFGVHQTTPPPGTTQLTSSATPALPAPKEDKPL